MSEKASLRFRSRNPDILTCIANLSNDEVFTPPEFANQMLDALADAWAADHDGANIWADKSVRFLDPCSKSGVFLREITRRLTEGLAEEITDLQERVDHILTQQVFGIGITRLTAMLARRSVYCSRVASGRHSVGKTFRKEEGNIWWRRVDHAWQNGKCRFCGASEATLGRSMELESHAYAFIHTERPGDLLRRAFGSSMKFDVIIGNPPYQLDDGGHGTSAAPIYQLFVNQAKALDPRYICMVIPSRWFSGGKGLDDFRQSMLSDDRIRVIEDYLSAADVFPGVGLKGGVCYFLWNRDNRGSCSVSTHFKDWVFTRAVRPLLENGVEIFVRFNDGLNIVRKVVSFENGDEGTLSLLPERRFDVLVSSLRPFGFRTYYSGRATKRSEDVLVYQNGGVGFTSRDEVLENAKLIDSWKVYIGRAAPGTGNRDTYPHKIISTPFIGEPGSICTETYLCIGPLSSREEAESVTSYLSCRLTRFLILMHKPSADTTRKVYKFVPKQDWSVKWTDEALYSKYGISAKEKEFIERMVRPMDLNLFGELADE